MIAFEKVRGKATRDKKIGRLALIEERNAYLFLLPWLVGLLLFLVIPVVSSLGLSLTNWNLITPPEWVGLKNYQDMVTDSNFLNSIGVTLKYLVMSVPLYMVAGLGLSLLLNLRIKGMNVFRTILYLPSVLSTVAVAVLQPRLAVLDETDSGLDIDALKIVADGVNRLRSPERSMIVITHYQRLLNYIVPDVVHVLAKGRVVKTGGKELALELEAKGYAEYVGEAA
jgi:ABC-type sugar transport system permease subunit